MESKKYYIGLDIGTDSVGYAVTDEEYNLCKFKGEPMWGVTLFDAAKSSEERRAFRTARRRLDRRQQRVQLLSELFAKEIASIDGDFFIRIKSSYRYAEDRSQKVRLFGSYAEQKAYTIKYPTIHHLICDLMSSKEYHDPRLVYIACAWLVAHRGHFLNEVDKRNISAVTDFNAVFNQLVSYITRDEYVLPWKNDVDICEVEQALKAKLGILKKTKLLSAALFGTEKAPKTIDESYEYNYELVMKLLCGGDVSLEKLFGKEEYSELDKKSIALNAKDEDLALVMQSIDESDAEFITVLKGIYDWSVLVDILKGKGTISEAKVAVYEQHEKDLYELKVFIKKYIPDKYNAVFRSESIANNYVAYVGKNKTANSDNKIKRHNSQEDFCKYVLSIVKSVVPDENDAVAYNDMIARLELGKFMPKQVNGDSRVIPYQLFWYELNKVLENAREYLTFLNDTDEEGLSVFNKILSVFEFRVPYYVGPLKEKSENRKLNHWMVRKAEGKIYPWNFDRMVDLDASEDVFIKRMINACTYIPGEDVLPKNSLCYCAFNVLNEINNIKINGVEIPVSVKQALYNDLFMYRSKVTVKAIKNYLVSNNYMQESDALSGIDISIKSSLNSFIQFKNLISSGVLSYQDVEDIIGRATYSEDKARFSRYLRNKYADLPDEEIRRISNMKFKDFGRLSQKLLCGIYGTEKSNEGTGECFTIMEMMWNTNCNLMQLLSDKYTFSEVIEGMIREYYDANPKTLSERLDETYVSNSVKRPIIRTLDILNDVVKVQKSHPKMIFIEMARGGTEDQKGKRTNSRYKQLCDLYDKIDTEDVRILRSQLESMGDTVHNKLQSDKLFLYYLQLGKCLYTGQPISLESVVTGDGKYNIEHIYPRSFVKDDSVINNKILVDSKANGDKGDSYPIDSKIQEERYGLWSYLHAQNLLSDEKFKRLTRKTRFTEEEKYEFINRQLVETRQSTKVVATLLKEIYPETEIVYVKAGLVSDFRHEFDLLKSRQVNDLHHAKDAYLNIVTGNVWYHKFSRQFYIPNADNNIKTGILFGREQKVGNSVVWRGGQDIDKVKRMVTKNTPHVTKYAFCRKGGLFDQMPLSAATGLIPRKQNMPTEIYGGYNKSTASFFVLVKFKAGNKQDVMVMPVELLYADKFKNDETFALEYAKQTVAAITGKPVEVVEFLLNKRIIKINTMLSLNGFRVCITGKASGGKVIGVLCMTAFKTSRENEMYIKRLESFEMKHKKNSNIIFSEKYDEISAKQNLALYDCYMAKLGNSPYKYRPANPCLTLEKGRDKFLALSPEQQVSALLSIQSLFGRTVKADLTAIGGVASAGVATLSSCLSNWKKTYTDVRIIDSSASGLFEKVSENLLDLI